MNVTRVMGTPREHISQIWGIRKSFPEKLLLGQVCVHVCVCVCVCVPVCKGKHRDTGMRRECGVLDKLREVQPGWIVGNMKYSKYERRSETHRGQIIWVQ